MLPICLWAQLDAAKAALPGVWPQLDAARVLFLKIFFATAATLPCAATGVWPQLDAAKEIVLVC